MTATDTRPNQREAILDTALRLMSAHGAAGMSMRQLATACGVQVAAIYHYFASKDALLAAVVAERQYGTRLADPLPVDRDAAPEVRLRQLFVHVWVGALEEEQIWRLILGEGIRGEEAVLPVGRDLLVLVEAAAREWIRELLPEVTDVDLAARLMVAQLLSGFVRRVFHGDPAGDDSIVAEATDTLVKAVLPS